jgi:hypothetical protein
VWAWGDLENLHPYTHSLPSAYTFMCMSENSARKINLHWQQQLRLYDKGAEMAKLSSGIRRSLHVLCSRQHLELETDGGYIFFWLKLHVCCTHNDVYVTEDVIKGNLQSNMFSPLIELNYLMNLKQICTLFISVLV